MKNILWIVFDWMLAISWFIAGLILVFPGNASLQKQVSALVCAWAGGCYSMIALACTCVVIEKWLQHKKP